MLPMFLRVPMKVATIVLRRDPQCSVRKAVSDIWAGHRRPLKVSEMRQRMALLDKDTEGNELWSTPFGATWVPAGGGLDTVLAELEHGVYNSPSNSVEIRHGDVVIDCGAHVGAFCRYALQRGASRVVAIEITPKTRVCLERNLAEDIENGKASIVPLGVWSEETTLELNISEGSLSNTVVDARYAVLGRSKSTTLSVPVTTIDALVANMGLPQVDFIKMDIEGAEREALVGARETLRRSKPRLAIASYHLPDDREAISTRTAQANPTYAEELGTCLILHGRVLPETLFFS